MVTAGEISIFYQQPLAGACDLCARPSWPLLRSAQGSFRRIEGDTEFVHVGSYVVCAPCAQAMEAGWPVPFPEPPLGMA